MSKKLADSVLHNFINARASNHRGSLANLPIGLSAHQFANLLIIESVNQAGHFS